ncbi:MAG: hypothetical protein HY894_09155 [Deltaproteobacteria bacterium]|nr:hypothetical protein [Deltaproteobacteria bacterium]
MRYPVRPRWTALSFFAVFLLAGQAMAKTIFVLDKATGVVAEYETERFGKKASHQIPKDLYFSRHDSDVRSKGLLVSASVRILYYDDEKNVEGLIRRLWYFDGAAEARAEVSKNLRCLPGNDNCAVMDRLSPPRLDAGAPAFYWGLERVTGYKAETMSREARLEIYRLGLDGRGASGRLTEERVADVDFTECVCGTGVCEETCAQGVILSEREGIKDFLAVEHLIEGQIGSSVDGYTYFEKKGDKWLMTGIDKNLKKTHLRAIRDEGCCGWANENSGQLILVVANGKGEDIIYDEYERFDNRDYDVSFSPVDAELSPDVKAAAYTIMPDEWALKAYKESGSIRLSEGGKENPKALASIKAALADMPVAEVMPVSGKTADAAQIKKAEFVGWMDNARILILKDGYLAVFDTGTRRMTKSPVAAGSVDEVFLR